MLIFIFLFEESFHFFIRKREKKREYANDIFYIINLYNYIFSLAISFFQHARLNFLLLASQLI